MEPSAQFESRVMLSPGHSHQCYIPVPNDIAQLFSEQGITRVKALINSDYPLHCALSSRGELGFALYFGKAQQEASGIGPDTPVSIVLAPEDSPYGLPMPNELAEVLAIDEEAQACFERLTPGKQRSIIHLVSKPKREATRISRALRIAENLKLGISDPREFLKKP